QIKAWLDRCSSHPDCGRPGYGQEGRAVPQPQLPYRVLDLGQTPDAVVKLAETSQWEDSRRHAEYACLSHCWGDSRPDCITTRENYEKNKRGIELSRFSKTFRHAVALCRELGFRYLWIDSCYIIQDDEADWRSQSAEMCNIFKNATITVAAAASRSGDEGCF
ncbi:uncharacterized protein THITE_2016489, partial [Thermothielavioides terrestris NRRL 8126]